MKTPRHHEVQIPYYLKWDLGMFPLQDIRSGLKGVNKPLKKVEEDLGI